VDLQTRKRNLISYLTQMKDKLFFDKSEHFILQKEATQQPDLKPMTVEALIQRIKQSE